jgi:hypothetical protein
MIDKTIGRTLAGQPKKSPETFGVAHVFTLMLLLGVAVLGGGSLLLLIAII